MIPQIKNVTIPQAALQRLPNYLKFLRLREAAGDRYVSSTVIAEGMHLNPVQVRKDIAMISSASGKPKTGFVLVDLIRDLEKTLGYTNASDAVLVGVGSLGKAFLTYTGFHHYGLNIAAAFDTDPAKIGTEIGGKPIYSVDRLEEIVTRDKIRLGIISVPKAMAQSVADCMVASGIKGIWNFAPTHLSLPQDIVVQNEDLAASLAFISIKVSQSLTQK